MPLRYSRSTSECSKVASSHADTKPRLLQVLHANVSSGKGLRGSCAYTGLAGIALVFFKLHKVQALQASHAVVPHAQVLRQCTWHGAVIKPCRACWQAQLRSSHLASQLKGAVHGWSHDVSASLQMAYHITSAAASHCRPSAQVWTFWC